MSDVLIQLFADVLQVEPSVLDDNISPDTLQRWDSLAAMHLVAAIEEKFKIELSTKEIMEMSSIGRTRKILQGKNVQV